MVDDTTRHVLMIEKHNQVGAAARLLLRGCTLDPVALVQQRGGGTTWDTRLTVRDRGLLRASLSFYQVLQDYLARVTLPALSGVADGFLLRAMGQQWERFTIYNDWMAKFLGYVVSCYA
jgi:hypothetical protein